MTPVEPSRSLLALVLDAPSVERVDRAFRDGAATYGRFDLAPEAFRRAVAERALRHWRAQGVDADRARVADYVRDAALFDVYLAVACEAGDERAWDALSRGLRPRLEGFAVRRGASSAEAQSVVQDVLGDLALPPPNGSARTLLGTFDGAGSLFGWTSIVVLRRLAAKARGRKIASLDAASVEARESAAPAPAAARPTGPLEGAEGRESDGRFRAALAAAWTRLSGQERCALVWKHRDGLSQRRIGDLLRVGEARVSRVVASAVEKLASGIRGALDEGGAAPLGVALWGRLAAAVSDHWASVAVDPPPPSGEASRRDASPEPGDL